MKTSKDNLGLKKPLHKHLKHNLRQYAIQIKQLQGDPHYVALGMAIGVFIGVTPTIPFHTLIAVALAFLFRCSKPAAALGVWFANPLTIPFFYLASYKVGMFFLGKASPFDIEKYESILEIFKLGADVTLAMLFGGIIIGIPPAVGIYFITRRIFTRIRSRSAGRILSRNRG